MHIIHRAAARAAAALLLACAGAAGANGLGENPSWQFQTSADRANKAFLEDLRQRKLAGMFQAPIYNTRIDRQYNCNVAATSTANEGVNSLVGNAPTSTAASASATGNVGDARTDAGANGGAANDQLNSGDQFARARGDSFASIRDARNQQALNSDQANSGDQSATVSGSTGCAFGVLN